MYSRNISTTTSPDVLDVKPLHKYDSVHPINLLALSIACT
jgi:hypothetical protein